MPGRLSTEAQRQGGGMEEHSNGHPSTAANERQFDDTNHGVDVKRLVTQCPTPPTDPFPDFEAVPTPTNAGNSRKALKYDAVTGNDTYPSSLQDDLTNGSEAGRPSSRTDNIVSTKPRAQSNAKQGSRDGIRKLSASQMQALTSAPDSLPVAVVATPQRKPNGSEYPLSANAIADMAHLSIGDQLQDAIEIPLRARNGSFRSNGSSEARKPGRRTAADFQRPPPSARTLSSPPVNRRPPPGAPTSAPLHNRRNSFNPLPKPTPLNLNLPPKSSQATTKPTPVQTERPETPPRSPLLPTIPLPPMSLPTHLQLELAGQRPSPLYIHQSHSADSPYESSAVKCM